MRRVVLFVLGIFLVCTADVVAESGKTYAYAIRAGKILTMAPRAKGSKSLQVINHGIILVSQGKIEALGPESEVDIPSGYTIIEAGQYWVMPGIVESHCHVGADMGDLNDMVMQVNPELRASDVVWLDDLPYTKAISGGVTTIHTMPGSGTNQGGFTVIIKTDPSDPDNVILREFGAMKATQAFNPERRGGDLGATRMGMSWLLRQFLAQARSYHEGWVAYEQGDTQEKPQFKPQWENLRRVFNKEIPTIVHTYSTWGVMQTIRMFNDENHLPVIATHTAFGGYGAAREAAKRPDVSINIGPRVVEFRSSVERDNRFHGMGAEYAQAGVKNLSINTDSVSWTDSMAPQEELASQATVSARYGLDDQAALEGITINAARALKIDQRVGSLEVGKDADIVIKKTSLIDPTTPVEMVLVNGRIAYQRKDTDLITESPL
ncbi:MAG: amidohydrolase family protein [Phycisphaerae bacterium]|nr:amidohydrolase family protein [Phycisphaerae bacterium]